MDSHFAIFGVLSWKLWPKERSWIKFTVWSCPKLQLCNMKFLKNSYGNFMTPWNHEIHNLEIQELHLGITRILTILVQPKPSIKKNNYKEEGWWFLSKYGSCECNESKTSLWLKVNSICINHLHCLAYGGDLSMIFLWLSHCPSPILDLF